MCFSLYPGTIDSSETLKILLNVNTQLLTLGPMARVTQLYLFPEIVMPED